VTNRKENILETNPNKNKSVAQNVAYTKLAFQNMHFTFHQQKKLEHFVSLSCQYFNKILGPITLIKTNNNFIILTAMSTLLSTTTI
jgi:hypothetical protein